jgi:hypothetical protein
VKEEPAHISLLTALEDKHVERARRVGIWGINVVSKDKMGAMLWGGGVEGL